MKAIHSSVWMRSQAPGFMLQDVHVSLREQVDNNLIIKFTRQANPQIEFIRVLLYQQIFWTRKKWPYL